MPSACAAMLGRDLFSADSSNFSPSPGWPSVRDTFFSWSVQGAMTQGDLASWIVAGSYKSIASASHAYDLGLSYSTQEYAGANPSAITAVGDTNRNVGELYAFDRWEIGGGAGLRFLLHKRSRTNICFDVGIGRSSHGIYVGLTEAF